MRLWSLHPRLLDSKGLVALWREGLLAFAVLRGGTRGYVRHPQLERFRNHPRPLLAIRSYLHFVCDEARIRGFRFDRSKLGRRIATARVQVTEGQLQYELAHLKKKLRMREPARYRRIRCVTTPDCHPLFKKVRGGIESWERPRIGDAPSAPRR